MTTDSDLWLFGYGSLIWRPDFVWVEACPGVIRGWARRFWQASVDHRGVPHYPGRVVTLVPDPGAECPGMGYRINADRREEILVALDYRERGGYARHKVSLALDDGRTVEALVYLANSENPCYAGAAPAASIASRIARARGASGTNRDYFLKLVAFLQARGVIEPHVEAIHQALSEWPAT
ncbi:MAG: gamma-glutamylcyclotransferase [Gammaproteobacteria bacterium]